MVLQQTDAPAEFARTATLLEVLPQRLHRQFGPVSADVEGIDFWPPRDHRLVCVPMLLVDMPNLSTGNGTANTSICGTIEEPHHDLHLVQPFVLS